MISIIIPVAPKDEVPAALLEDLSLFPKETERIIVPATRSLSGRANCMNAGAQDARGDHLFFLHADSRLPEPSILALLRSMETGPDGLHYFDLAFHPGSSPLMLVTQWGVLFRSRILHTPYGDQGFCIRKDLFWKLGGFPADVALGEDHFFLRHARRSGIPLVPVKAPIFTSARKYEEHGWLKTTLIHNILWRKQIRQDRGRWEA